MQTSTGALAGSRRGAWVGRGPCSTDTSAARSIFAGRPLADVCALRLAAPVKRLKRPERITITAESKFKERFAQGDN
eukprot:9139390-Karenia_brevis.AAC.4